MVAHHQKATLIDGGGNFLDVAVRVACAIDSMTGTDQLTNGLNHHPISNHRFWNISSIQVRPLLRLCNIPEINTTTPAFLPCVGDSDVIMNAMNAAYVQ
jgi:hypothetical protein